MGDIPMKCFIKLIIVRMKGIIMRIKISVVFIPEFDNVFMKRERKKYLLIPSFVFTSIKLYPLLVS